MIQLPNHIQPTPSELSQLATWQADITGDFPTQSARAKLEFKRRNRKSNRVFKEVKKSLILMCPGARRCVYCEDSVADEVEHIAPKDLFPELVFVWDNYVYACGNCNGPKNNKFAVFRSDTGALQWITPPHWTGGTKPPPGSQVLINPRKEDPLTFALLDLKSTFQFVPLPGTDPHVQLRYDYTYNEVLRLNHEEREFLREAREEAYGDYKARMVEYDKQKRQGANPAKLNKLIAGVRKKGHPTVWREMQRWHNNGWLSAADTDLNDLFVLNPESLTW